MPMLYLNVRQTQPMIGIRTQKDTLDAGIIQPRYGQETQMPRSNKGVTQPKLTIDSYPSRHSYGYTNHTDFAREHGQQGFADVGQSTARHMQMGWTLAEDGPKPGRQVAVEFARNDMMRRVTQQRTLVAQHIPKPEIHWDVGQVVGEPDTGHTTPQWDVEHQARVHYKRGSIEIYLKQKGDVRSWVSTGTYDIRA